MTTLEGLPSKPEAPIEDLEGKRPDSPPVKDPNIVDWDGDDDAANPLNWSKFLRNLHVILVSLFTLFCNLAASMFAPGAQELAADFNVTNSTIATFTVTIYILGFALGPLLLAPLSELYGRRIIYHFCSIFYFAFTLGCALSKNVAMFLVFRLICGCVASGPMSVGAGTVADVTLQEERGKAMALFAIGPLLGPVIGPVIGGFVSEDVGWRWTFWIILILCGIYIIGSSIFMRETNSTVLLERKTQGLRKETGNPKLIPRADLNQTPREMLLRAIIRPAKMLIFSPVVLFLSLYAALVFGTLFLLFATIPVVFGEQYGFNPGVAGLTYLGLGLGMLLGLVLFYLLSDKLLGQKKGGTAARPELRLILMKWFAPITPIGCFIYGWSAYYQIHWIVPILGTFVIGFGTFFIIMPVQIYLVDAFGSQAAASAIAANLVVRNVFGTFLPLAAPPLYGRLGLGWGNSLLGFVCLGFMPVPWLFYRYGEYMRTRFAVQL